MKELHKFTLTRANLSGLPEKDMFDSDEEYWFALWCVEALRAGVLDNFSYHTVTFDLTKKHRIVMANKKNFILHPHAYTPDFSLRFNIFMPEIFIPIVGYLYRDLEFISIIDVKGQFQLHGGDRAFSLNQKMTMEKFGVPVHKVVPEKFFKKTWAPKAIVAGKRIPRLKKWRDCKLIDEILR